MWIYHLDFDVYCARYYSSWFSCFDAAVHHYDCAICVGYNIEGEEAAGVIFGEGDNVVGGYRAPFSWWEAADDELGFYSGPSADFNAI